MMSVFSILVLIFSVVQIVAAAILYFYPPKEINGIYGYRTPASQKNKAQWNFAQRHAATQTFIFSIISVIIFLISLLVNISEKTAIILFLFYIFFMLYFLIYRTENAIKKKFDLVK
jgi:uncharacterized membrane protein